eukprot:334914-Amphidinium_carterae.4
MTRLRTTARRALGKLAGRWRSAPLELMAHGAADAEVSADLRNRRILAGKRVAAGTSPLGRCPQARKGQRADTQLKAAC